MRDAAGASSARWASTVGNCDDALTRGRWWRDALGSCGSSRRAREPLDGSGAAEPLAHRLMMRKGVQTAVEWRRQQTHS